MEDGRPRPSTLISEPHVEESAGWDRIIPGPGFRVLIQSLFGDYALTETAFGLDVDTG
jgi:hypothetical protein